MSIIRDLIIEKAITFESTITTADLDRLRDFAHERTWSQAENQNIYYSHAMANLDFHGAYEPEPADVAEYLDAGDEGDWRKAMTVAATIATQRALYAETEADVAKLVEAIAEAQSHGFEVTGIHADCLHGWAPHQSESDWTTGTLHLWVKLEGGPDARLLRVALAGGAEVWLALSPDD
jgi:hypothetical protein